jgi:hypothetical protein
MFCSLQSPLGGGREQIAIYMPERFGPEPQENVKKLIAEKDKRNASPNL